MAAYTSWPLVPGPWRPGIFRVFKPERIEKIITESQSKDAAVMEELIAKHITPVVVPDNDPDHQGTVYDDPENEPELFPVEEPTA